MPKRRTFSDAIKQNARVQLDWSGRGKYHLFFAIGTETYLASRELSLSQMERVLVNFEGYVKVDEQFYNEQPIKTYAKPDCFTA